MPHDKYRLFVECDTSACQDIVKYDKQEMIPDLDLKQMPAAPSNVDCKSQTTAG